MTPHQFTTGQALRLAARSNTFRSPTPGLAPGYLQANLLILPSHFADDFRLLCQRNPVPCPLLAESQNPGDFSQLKSHVLAVSGKDFAEEVDVRTDAPAYSTYLDGIRVEQDRLGITDLWTKEHVAFLIGCSFSFENALIKANLPPAHITSNRNVPMYRTNIPLNPAGVFTGGTYVVSMRPYRMSDVETVRLVTKPYMLTHGEPIAWGWDAVASIGIKNINKPEWGDIPQTLNERSIEEREELIPVFWGCGVTPQEAVMRAKLPGLVMGHLPGHMLVLDLQEKDLLGEE